jgi:hypothetical protein
MPHARLVSALAAAALLSTLGACASFGREVSRDTLLSEAPRHPGRACGVAPRPEQLPEPAQLVDGDFGPEAARIWEAAGRPAGYVLLSMGYDREGVNVRRAVIERSPTVTPEMADELQRAVFAHRLQAAPVRDEWGVRLRVDLGAQPALRVGRREQCRAAPREWEHRSAAGGFGGGYDVRQTLSSSLSAPSPADRDLVWVRVRLDAQGIVTDARVERTIMRGSWESRVLGYVRTLQFLPALEDGQPVPGEASLPLRLGALR